MTTETNPNIFLFYGEDNYSCNEKLNFWKREFIRKFGDNNLETLEGKKVKLNELESNIESHPFLSEKKMVIIKDFFKGQKAEAQKKLATFLPKVPDFCLLIFQESENPDKRLSLYKKIEQIGKLEHFPTLTLNALAKKVLEDAKKNNLKISFSTANFLCEYCGLNLWQIKNELEKLAMFAQDQEITVAMIEELVPAALSSSIFKLTDALANKKVQESLKTFKTLVDSNEDIVKIFFMIVRHFRLLIQTKEMLDKNEATHSIIKALKQHPFVIQNMSRQAKNFTMEKLEKIHQNLLEIDKKVKIGQIKIVQNSSKEMNLEIEKLIINC